jgi:hypothetical protein
MCDKLIIIGAGVDHTKGIDFPLASSLLLEIVDYLKNDEGKVLDKELRSMLPNLRFSFSNLIAKSVEKIVTHDIDVQRSMISRVQEVIDKLSPDREKIKKHGKLLIQLFNKLMTVTKTSGLDETTRNLIQEVFPNDADDIMDSDSILDLSLSDTFKSVLKRTLKIGFNARDNEVATALVADMLNFENLLIEKFLGFYNNNQSEIKNYLYISWMLWAYLVHKQKQVVSNFATGTIPFYNKLPQDCRAITLNYTSFIERQLGRNNVIYFHGGLAEYISMGTRELVQIENIADIDTISFLRGQANNISLDDNDITQHRHVIPAMVPPLRLKPILSYRYIESWHSASEWVKNSKKIIIVGYSFNSADEHFNDILRQDLSRKPTYIVGPDVLLSPFLQRIGKVFRIDASHWVDGEIQNHKMKKAGSLYLIKANADNIDITDIFNRQD